MFSKLAIMSLLERKGSVFLSLLAMSVSIFVLLGVENIRYQAKDSFSNTVSGVDLVVGARTGSLNLLLYSVFRIGTPTNNIRWQTYKTIGENELIQWSIPISLGDSHKGFRVLGTNTGYFEHFSYGNKHKLDIAEGKVFNEVFDVVLGAEVAKKLDYKLGDKIILSHGIAKTSFSMHDETPFTVVGILDFTGTPVDQTLHVSLQGIEAIHVDWQHGTKNLISQHTQAELANMRLKPKAITAFMLGLKSKVATFKMQRIINNYPKEPLTAILPGVTLTELWQLMGSLESALLIVSILVFVSACLGVSSMLLSSLRERKREIQLLRIIGASPGYIFWLIEIETLLITTVSLIIGSCSLVICLVFMQDYLVSNFGVHIGINLLTLNNLYLIATLIASALVVALIPSFSGYSRARADNL